MKLSTTFSKLLKSRARRGQTLMLFACMMLFLVLLVCMTLSTGMKVKEKMEVQAVADAAAYSNAVTTARIYNEVALLQRAQIGHFVAMSSVQALTSWTGFWRTQINNTRNAYRVALAPYLAILACCALPVPEPFCKPQCVCAAKAVADIYKTQRALDQYQRELNNKWDNLDDAAGAQLKALQGTAKSVYDLNQTGRYLELNKQLGGNLPAKAVVNKAKGSGAWAGEWSAPMSAAVINVREAGVLKSSRQLLAHHLYAANGSRGYTFTTNRALGGVTLTARMMFWLTQKGYTPDLAVLTNDGNAYWGRTRNHGKLPATSTFAWADDHGGSAITFLRMQPPCIPSAGYWYAGDSKTYLKATDQTDTSDQHVFQGGRRDNEPARTRHNLGRCVQNSAGTNCPGMWVGFVDYDIGRLVDPTALFGQPTNLAVIQRDYGVRGARADPWNLFFKFRFAQSGSDIQFDNSGMTLADGTNIAKQTAVSSGIAYYHRANHWREPPNFLNPYWRATLVPIGLDQGSGVTAALAGAGATWASEAWVSLKAAGYKDYIKVE